MAEQTKTYEQTLEAFFASEDFESGVISSTKASWGGSDYRVELLLDGSWQVLWKNQIGNLYETPGIILVLPTVDTDEMQEYVDSDAGTEEDFLSEAFDCEREDLAQSMRNDLHDDLVMMEMNHV